MSDIVHARKAEQYLHDTKVGDDASALPVELALIHANLAVARAVREVDTSVRLGMEKVAVGVKGAPPVYLMRFEDSAGDPIYLNLRALNAVRQSAVSENMTVVELTGDDYTVLGDLDKVSHDIYAVVGAW